MPNQWEIDHHLNPNDATDANQDRDGDGVSNLDEYRIASGNNIPSVTAPADIILSSKGYKTQVNLGNASAIDALDGVLAVEHDAGNRRFRPGRHFVTWSATNRRGKANTSIQQIDVLPRARLKSQRIVREGKKITVTLKLNGDAPEYPIVIPVIATGSATQGDDYHLSAKNIIIESGRTGTLEVTTNPDAIAEGTETIILTIGDITANALIGGRNTLKIHIKEINSAPHVRLSVQQNNRKGRLVKLNDGVVTVRAIAKNTDGEALSYQWHSNSLIDQVIDSDQSTFEFDPADMGVGEYKIQVTVRDEDGKQTRRKIKLRVKSSAGKSNKLFIDDNENGVPNLLDEFASSNMMAGSASTDVRIESPIETEPGLYLSAGDIGFDQEVYQGRISKENIKSYLNNNALGAYLDSDQYQVTNDIYDYQIKGLDVNGQSVYVVFTLSAPIKAHASLRKYSEVTGWSDYVVSENNTIHSWSSDVCTFPSENEVILYKGMQEDANCLQVMIEDGGPNDADGEANGEINDPIAVATLQSSGTNDTTTNNSVNSNASSGGGGLFSSKLMIFILFFSLFVFYTRKVKSK